ncbi:MAG: hypothetical protein ACLP9Y_22530 [Mycobacterium sp.]
MIALRRYAAELEVEPERERRAAACEARRARGHPQRLDEAVLYILDLRHAASLERRWAKAAAVMTDVFERSKHTGG